MAKHLRLIGCNIWILTSVLVSLTAPVRAQEENSPPPDAPAAATPAPSEAPAPQPPQATEPAPQQQEAPPPPVQVKEGKPSQGLPSEGFLQSYDYDPTNKRDPFALPRAQSPGGMGPFLPLQRYDVDQLRLTGVIWDVKKPKAMVRDPAGQVHFLLQNDKIGKNNGYVAVIREGEIVVVEPIQDDGRVIFSTKLMKLAK